MTSLKLPTLGSLGQLSCSAGAKVYFRGAQASLPAYPEDEVADTTGAGDAFRGGFLARLLILGADQTGKLDMDILKDAVNYGNVSGSLAVRKKARSHRCRHEKRSKLI